MENWPPQNMIDAVHALAFPGQLYSEPAVRCPICESEYVHIERVTVKQGPELLTVAREKRTVVFNQPVHERGSVVTIACWCESEDHFELVFKFHKGALLFTVERTHEHDPAQEPGNDEGPGCTFPTEGALWRD